MFSEGTEANNHLRKLRIRIKVDTDVNASDIVGIFNRNVLFLMGST